MIFKLTIWFNKKLSSYLDSFFIFNNPEVLNFEAVRLLVLSEAPD